MDKSVRVYLQVLAVLAVLGGIGYYFVTTTQPPVFSVGYLALLYMPTPLYALLITSKLLKEKLQLKQYGSPRNVSLAGIGATIGVFAAWIIVFILLTAVLSQVLPSLGGVLVSSDAELHENLVRLTGDAAATAAELPSLAVVVAMALLAAVVAGWSVNLLFALGEEYGWRGFLQKKLTGGFLKKQTLIGLLWGVWHAPIILQGYNYGAEYRIAGALMFIVFTICFGYIFGLLHERYKNVLYAGALHGMFNGLAGIFPLVITGYHPLVGGPVGVISAISFLIVAGGFFLSTKPAKE